QLERAETGPGLREQLWERDVVVVPEPVYATVMREVEALPLETRPRLLVTSGWRGEWRLRPPEGVSIVSESAPNPSSDRSFLEALLLGIVDDLPLHHVVAALRETFPDKVPTLVADPASVNDLRMADALAGAVSEVAALKTVARIGDPLPFLERLDAPTRALLAPAFNRIRLLSEPIEEATRHVGHREGPGAAPAQVSLFARSAWTLAARAAAAEVDRELLNLARDPRVVGVFSAHQERRADFEL